MRRIGAIASAFCWWLLLAAMAGEAMALDLTKLEAQGYISDFAGVVDTPAREAINRYLAAVEKATGAQVAIVTLPSLDGEPIEDVANQLYRRWGVGKKETNEGALFLFAIQERRSRLEVGYGLEPVLPDGAAGSLLRAMRPALRAGQYSEAFLEAARQLGARLAGAKGVVVAEELPARRAVGRQGRSLLDEVPVGWLVVGALVLLWLVSRAMGGGRRRRFGSGPWIMPGGFGGGFGGGSGGSGSSWGGFGGGDSGGGGASSDW